MSGPGRTTTRRRFLFTALGVGGALALTPLKPWRALVEISDSPLAARLSGLLEHDQSAAAVGAEYLGQLPHGEATRTALVDAIISGLPGGRRAIVEASASELRELLFDIVRRDFDEEVTVNLRGWIVSCTEARLCGLSALEQSKGA